MIKKDSYWVRSSHYFRMCRGRLSETGTGIGNWYPKQRIYEGKEVKKTAGLAPFRGDQNVARRHGRTPSGMSSMEEVLEEGSAEIALGIVGIDVKGKGNDGIPVGQKSASCARLIPHLGRRGCEGGSAYAGIWPKRRACMRWGEIRLTFPGTLRPRDNCSFRPG